jgi:hypothetical protein
MKKIDWSEDARADVRRIDRKIAMRIFATIQQGSTVFARSKLPRRTANPPEQKHEWRDEQDSQKNRAKY